MTLEDISETVRELAREEDPNQVARILDEFVDRDGRSVVSGYNDRAGYFLTPKEPDAALSATVRSLLENDSEFDPSDLPMPVVDLLRRGITGRIARETDRFISSDHGDDADAPTEESFNIDIEDPSNYIEDDWDEGREGDDGK